MRAEIRSDRGTGTPLVFLPGMDGTGELLMGTAERLETRFRLLTVRYVGDGQPGSAATYDGLADTAAAALAAAGVQRALVLAESFGGGVALTLALRHPELVRGLALVNSFAWFPQRARLRAGSVLLHFTPKALVGWARLFTVGHVFFRPRRDRASEDAFLKLAKGYEDASFVERLTAIRHLDLRERLNEIRVPCRLWASTHDRVVPSRRTMKTLLEGLPDATLETIQRANHIVLPLAEEPWVERLGALESDALARNELAPRTRRTPWRHKLMNNPG